MKTRSPIAMAIIASFAVAACSGVPERNMQLDSAEARYRAAQGNPSTSELAASEMQQAADALSRANGAWVRQEPRTDVDHLAYIAGQRVAIAVAVGDRRSAERAVSRAGADRDATVLAARTSEADDAQRSAESARRASEEARRQSDLAQRDAEAARGQAAAATEQARDAQTRNSALEARLAEMNAKKTDRGLVVTMGDVLFDTNQSMLRPGGLRNVDKLVAFLKQYPERTALIEGFTDSTGSEVHNQELSARRAESVRGALVRSGIASARIATLGHGEAFPVGDNDTVDGRQLNRRVEIVLSEDGGKIPAR